MGDREDLARKSQMIDLRYNGVIEHLRSLTDSARTFYEDSCKYGIGGRTQEDFETELIRAEDFLEEVERNADLRI